MLNDCNKIRTQPNTHAHTQTPSALKCCPQKLTKCFHKYKHYADKLGTSKTPQQAGPFGWDMTNKIELLTTLCGCSCKRRS